MSTPEDGFILPHGGYEKLLSYQKSVIVYDGTVLFTKKWLPAYGDRTVDQMIQAARSGKQNIVEGSAASGLSKEMEVKLTNVALASLKELQEDYQDFLRTRQLPVWDAAHPYGKRLRELNRTPGATYATFRKGIENENPEIAANVLLGLVKVTCFLLTRQVQALEKVFLKEGGLRERMTRARLNHRAKDQRDQRDEKDEKDKND